MIIFIVLTEGSSCSMQFQSECQGSTYTQAESPLKERSASLDLSQMEAHELVVSQLERVIPEERESNDLPYSYSQLQGLSSQEDSQDLLIRLHQESVNILKQVYCKKRDLGLQKQRVSKMKEERYNLQLQVAQRREKSRIDEYQRRNTIENRKMRLRSEIDGQQIKIGCLRQHLQLLKEINTKQTSQDPMQQLKAFNQTVETEYLKLQQAPANKMRHLLSLQEILLQNIESLYSEFPPSQGRL